MEYQVPQFIEVQDKIIGPLTLRQFIYIAGTVGLCIVFFFYLPHLFSILRIIPTVALGVSLAFYKINGKPFIEMMEASFNFLVGTKFFLWKRNEPTKKELTAAAVTAREAEIATQAPSPGTPKLTRGKLTELAWSLDVSTNGPEAESDQISGTLHS